MFNHILFYNLTRRKFFYNITPIENVASIMATGILSYNNNHEEHISVADTDVQKRREAKIIPGGRRLHDYANLYFDARNPMMYKRKEIAEQLCVLAIDYLILNVDGVVLSDCNAASSIAKFIEPSKLDDSFGFDEIYATDWNSAIPTEYLRKKSKKNAEVLVPDVVPPDYIVAGCVVNNHSKRLLMDSGFEKKIYIKPDLFFR